MKTISLTAPKNPTEARNLAWAKKAIQKAEAQSATLIERDNTKDDFVPDKGSVSVGDMRLPNRASISGLAQFDPDTKELISSNVEQTQSVDVEVDHMMWGSFKGTSSVQVEKGEERSSYSVKEEVANKYRREYEIVVDHQNQTLSFDFEVEKGPWVGGVRGF